MCQIHCWHLPSWQLTNSVRLRRNVSTWKLAAGGLQRKWKGIKQRTAWRFRTLKDQNTAVVFSAEAQKEKEIHFKPVNRRTDDPLACYSVLAAASVESLNGILSATSPEDSSQFCKTMTGFMLHSSPPSMRAKVLDVLTVQRLHEISITNRAVIIRAIQRCLLSPLHTEKAVLRKAAFNILRGTYGKDLSILKEQIHANEEQLLLEEAGFEKGQLSLTTAEKSLTEDAPHSGDLSYLIYSSKSLTETVQVMQHIAIEATKVKMEEPQLIKVVSDIDDTLYPGWMDRRYPLHTPYPGVSDLYSRISRGLIPEPKRDHASSLITFLTARPRGWLSVGRYLTVQHLKSLGVPNATVLNGSVTGLVSSKKIASIKMENFTRFASIFPEFKFVFFGDSGQGDALLASKLLEVFPEQVLGTFIHDVNPAFKKTGDGVEKAIYASQGVHFFTTYAGAAVIAYEKGLISASDLLAVAGSAEKDLEQIVFTGPNAESLKQERWRELATDMQRVKDLLQA